MAPPVFKTGLAGNTLAGRFDSFPPPPFCSPLGGDPGLFTRDGGWSRTLHPHARRDS